MNLSTPLSRPLLRTTDDFVAALQEMEIHTVEDLILYLPRGYEDLSEMRTLSSCEEGEKVTVRGTISEIKQIRTRKRKMTLIQAVFTDTEGASCRVVWFNQPHIKRMFSDGADIVLTGKIGVRGNKLVLQSPTFEEGGRKQLLHAGRIVPIYPQHAIISTRWLREKMALIREAIRQLPETLSENVVSDEDLLSRAQTIDILHFPESDEDLQKARERLHFEELFHMQIDALKRKEQWQGITQERLKIPMDAELIKKFFATLHFTPTDSQKIAIYEILKDLEKNVPMSRLLEGDVGSGKTLVATAVIASVVHYGGQCALMVPTEVLARQHGANIQKLLKNSRIALLTGSTPAGDAKEIKLGLARGTIDVVVGTHALIQSSVAFHDLKLAIVDEQHRFGVLQRKALTEKGSPHFLSMTATPIPRTLALTAYGDHDLSVLLEKPGNRKPIKTKVVPLDGRKTMELWIDHEIDEGRQVYVICPLIADSETLTEVRNVTRETDRLNEAFPKRKIATLHGKLKPQEKNDIMASFKAQKADILVSTSVIEVGIDIPNTTIIVIEGAERFGLAQLHQLRGRVGRSDHQSYCFLCTTEPEQADRQRLRALEQTNDGFKLAEVDLKLRGPGELYGTKQSGIPEIRVGALTDPEMVIRARKAAEKHLSLT